MIGHIVVVVLVTGLHVVETVDVGWQRVGQDDDEQL